MEYFVLTCVAILIIGVFFFLKSFQIPAKIRKAEEHLEQGELLEASDLIKFILEKEKDNIQGRYLRARLLIKQNQFVMAISELNNLLASSDLSKYIEELEIHTHLAYLYRETKNYLKEIEEYKIILNFKPDDVTANHRIGHAFYRQGRFKQAKEHLQKAVTLDPQLKDSLLPLGVASFKVNDYDTAEQYLLAALKNAGDVTEAEYYLGCIYRMKKDLENAVLMFEKAKANRKYFTESLFKIGEIHFDLGQYEDAIATLEQGLNSLKENTEESHAYRYLLAECYEHENKIREALHHWEKIASENPSYRGTRMKLDSYKDLLGNESLMSVFAAPIDDLLPLIVDVISSLHFNIISKEKLNSNEYLFKGYNIKRINDPPLLICFNRTTREITEGQILDFHKRIADEKCKNGIYITTSKFSLRAKSGASSKMIDLYDTEFVNKFIEKSHLMRKRQ